MNKTHCKRCGRPLSSQKSISLGYGSKCYKIMQLYSRKPEISIDFQNELDFLKMEIKMLKRLLQNVQVNGVSQPIDTRKVVKQQIPDKYHQAFKEVISELKIVLEKRKIRIEQSSNLQEPPHAVSILA